MEINLEINLYFEDSSDGDLVIMANHQNDDVGTKVFTFDELLPRSLELYEGLGLTEKELKQFKKKLAISMRNLIKKLEK